MPKKLSNVLTPLGVKNAKAGRQADGSGLHLLVKASGVRSWVYCFMLSGKSRDIGLGSASGLEALSLATARDRAAALRLQGKAGVDPLAERQRKAAETLAVAQAVRQRELRSEPLLKRISPRMRIAGETPSIASNGATRSPDTPIPSLVTCWLPTLAPRRSCKFRSRFGNRSPRLPTRCAGGSKRS